MVKKLLPFAIAVSILIVSSCTSTSVQGTSTESDNHLADSAVPMPGTESEPREGDGNDEGPGVSADPAVEGQKSGADSATRSSEIARGEHRDTADAAGDDTSATDHIGPTGAPENQSRLGAVGRDPGGGQGGRDDESYDESEAGRPDTVAVAARPSGASPNGVAGREEGTSAVEPSPETRSAGREPVPLVNTELALDVRAGQVLMVQFRRASDGSPIRTVTPEVRRVMETVRPGGVILFAENIHTIDQTVALIRDLQETSDIPLFISVDEEGGYVSRLNRSVSIGATPVPSAALVGSTNDPKYARLAGRIIGTELSALGINMNMAPVADVNTNPTGGIIAKYERSFGTEPELVGEMVSAMVGGLQSAGVAAVLKHFPGHGDTDQDTHAGAVVSTSDIERLRRVELHPFRRGIETGADGVMTAHIAYPEITGDSTPATFSRTLLTDILRNELGFDGIIISDALEMGAVANTDLPTDPVVAAVVAGVDLVLSPRDPVSAHAALMRAVENGVLPPDRLNEAVENVLRAKARRGLFNPINERAINPSDVIGNSEHRRIISELLDTVESN